MDRARFREITSLIAFAAAMSVSLPLVAGFFDSAHPALDSIGHFRLHLAALMILCAAWALVGSMWRQGLAAIAFGLAAIGTTMGLQLWPAAGQANAGFHPRDERAPVYRLLHMNLRFDNAEPGKVLSMIGALRPDVLTFNEVSAMWREKLDLVAAAYPHRIVCSTGSRSGGVAILSLRPFAEGVAPECLEGGTMAAATVDFGGRLVEVGALHLHWPWPFSQQYQIDRLEAPLGELAETALLAGDLNATPWSHAARRIAKAGGLQPVRISGPTWLYRRLPEAFRFAGLPIDHIFAKGGVTAHAARTLEAAGSDHLPVLFEFSLPAPPAGPDVDAPTTVVQGSAAARPG